MFNETTVYVVVATFIYCSSVLETVLIGVYDSVSRAFRELENYDYMKKFNEELIGELDHKHMSKDFGYSEDSKAAYYCEWHHVKIKESTDDDFNGGTVSLTIFEKKVE